MLCHKAGQELCELWKFNSAQHLDAKGSFFCSLDVLCYSNEFHLLQKTLSWNKIIWKAETSITQRYTIKIKVVAMDVWPTDNYYHLLSQLIVTKRKTKTVTKSKTHVTKIIK